LTASTTAYPITYKYSGDTNFNGQSDASTTLTVNQTQPATAQVVLTADSNPSTVGQTVTFTVTVTGNSGVVPTGNVTISEPLGPNNVLIYGHADLVNGVAKIVVSATSAQPLTAGRHTLYATYGGGNGYPGATSPAYGLTVNPQQ
jgi:uncharacterized repeat protein (TIGR01451 family)